jgi:Fuc2NAc and GlcNAc transferase
MYILYITVVLSSFILTLLVRRLALAKQVMDIPNERSSHSIPTPRGGGLAVVIVWYLALTYQFFNASLEPSFYYMLLSGLILVVVGLADDIYSLPAGVRIVSQALAAGLALYFSGGFTQLDIGFYTIENTYILTPLAFVGIIWFINLFNFLDGIDGYISVEAIFIFAVLFFVFDDNIALILALAVLGFLFLNWQPAKIFMGDVGSTLIGFNVAVFAIYYQNTADISLISMLILSSLFWFDATFTLFRRFRNKERLTRAHKKHAYQRIAASGFSHQKTVFLALIFNVGHLALFLAAYKFEKYLLLFFLLSTGISYVFTKFADRRKAFD